MPVSFESHTVHYGKVCKGNISNNILLNQMSQPDADVWNVEDNRYPTDILYIIIIYPVEGEMSQQWSDRFWILVVSPSFSDHVF